MTTPSQRKITEPERRVEDNLLLIVATILFLQGQRHTLLRPKYSKFSLVDTGHAVALLSLFAYQIQCRCDPVGDNVTWPRITLQKTH